jgi:hypothetical protein
LTLREGDQPMDLDLGSILSFNASLAALSNSFRSRQLAGRDVFDNPESTSTSLEA